MLRRLVATLLIFPLLGSSLSALPHSHAGTGVAEPGDHDSRPHVHLHGHGHHHHHHGGGHHHHHHGPSQQDEDAPRNDAVSAIADHDGDVLYLSSNVTVGMNRQGVASGCKQHKSPTSAIADSALRRVGEIPGSIGVHPPPDIGFHNPQAMRTLSLRI